MKQPSISKFKRVSILLMSAPLFLPSCTRQPQPTRIEEITFQSGSFHVVGDLRLPEGAGPFQVVLFVHGSGPIDRTMFGYYIPVMETMLQAGYAVFSWDKPGYGESTGQLSDRRVYHQRAQIVLDAIEVMKERGFILHGDWGDCDYEVSDPESCASRCHQHKQFL